MATIRLNPGQLDSGRRIDRIIRVLYKDIPLSVVYKLFRSGRIKVNGKKVDGSYRCNYGDSIELDLPNSLYKNRAQAAPKDTSQNNYSSLKNKAPAELYQSFLKLVLYESKDLCIVNKPKGMLSHGSGGLDELARAYYSDKIDTSLIFRPAPLHRLDRNSSGAMAISASQTGALAFSKALRDGQIGKYYLTILSGTLDSDLKNNSAIWEDKLKRNSELKQSQAAASGAYAKLEVFPLASRNSYSLVLISLLTGRTHQIRAQAAARGLALLGDKKYGGREQLFGGGFLLHSAILELPPMQGLANAQVILAPLSAWAKKLLHNNFGPEYKKEVIIKLKSYNLSFFDLINTIF